MMSERCALLLCIAAALGCRVDAPMTKDMADADVDMSEVFPGTYPGFDALEETPELPELFRSHDGSRVATDVASWERWRRQELLDLFRFYLFGFAPQESVTVTRRSMLVVEQILPGVRYEELELRLGDLPIRLHVSLYSPAGGEAAPVFVAPNKCGNQEVMADARVRATTAWFDPSCGEDIESTRGVRGSNWPVDRIVDAGYAFATFHESEIDPDDDTDADFSDGVHPHLVPREREVQVRWGRIAAWSWGISRVLDGVLDHPALDATRVAVVGHSRRGKTALWTGAQDTRVGMVIAHQSGTGGTSLTRSLKGESVRLLNGLFPYWFNDVFPTFGRAPLRLPIDQHQLVALVAPRLMLATDGDGDAWADPEGSAQAIDAALPAWELYGVEGRGRAAWRTRPGGHALTEQDWGMFLEFAREHWPTP